MRRYTALLVIFAIFGCAKSVTSPLRIDVLPAAYAVAGKQVNTAEELASVITGTNAAEAQVVVQPNSSYEQVAAALRVLQQKNISIGLVGNVQSK